MGGEVMHIAAVERHALYKQGESTLLIKARLPEPEGSTVAEARVRRAYAELWLSLTSLAEWWLSARSRQGGLHRLTVDFSAEERGARLVIRHTLTLTLPDGTSRCRTFSDAFFLSSGLPTRCLGR